MSNILNNNLQIKKYFQDSRIFAYDDYICIFPAVGCFVKGYILISTFNHYLSLYDCSNEVIKDIERTVNIIKNTFLTELNSGTAFFEHGTISNYDLSSASIYHFHMHFLPINEPVWFYMNKKYNFEYYLIDNLMEIKSIVDKQGIKSYLLFGDYDNKLYLIDSTKKKFQSQFFRKVMYEYYYGTAYTNEWDWKKFPFYDKMQETINALNGMKI